MSSINDLFAKLILMKTTIENKGGTVSVAHNNPSPDELIAGIGTISGMIETSSMPTASESTMGVIYKYTGTTTSSFENNKYYITVNNGGTYSWQMVNCDATSQVIITSVMPTASSSTYGAIYKYIGTTDVDFVSGKYYMTVLSNGVYSWILVNETDIPESGKAMLIGYVIKSGGIALANQTVVIANTVTGDEYTLTTDAYGKFTKQVNAGTYTISVSATISGYTTPTTQTVTVVANQIDYTYMIYVQAVSAVFGENSWATISQVSQTIASQGMTSAQVLANYRWSLGDTKNITLSNGETISVRIIGFNHDTLSSDHTSKAGITLQMVDCLATRYPMNSSSTNAGGWNTTKMRTETFPTIKGLLPSDLQSLIKLVDKTTANGGGSGTIDVHGGNYSEDITTQDDLFLLSGIEIFGSGSSYGYSQSSNEGAQYEYWVNHNTNADRIKYYDNAGSRTATYWWERSSRYYGTSDFCIVSTSGNATNASAGNSRGVAFGFCI